MTATSVSTSAKLARADDNPSGDSRNLLTPEFCEVIAAPSDKAEKLLTGGFYIESEEHTVLARC